MSKILKRTGTEYMITDTGDMVPADSQLVIDPSKYSLYARSSDTIAAIASGDLVYNDGTEDLNTAEATQHLQGSYPKTTTIASQPAFADKHTTSGQSLFARETGVTGVTVAAGATADIVHTVSFPTVKINGAQIYGCQLGDTVNFKIKDSATGTYTTVPNYLLNQFGYNVNMPKDGYQKQYPYDADLYQGMQVVAEYTNNGAESVTIYVNLDIHEVK